MAKKRGGLAGLYDRNKGIIKKAAPVLAGMVGGPLAGAAVGAAMRGLDREGKSGIGFDVGQGVRGGLEGYAGGAAGKGLKGMFTAGMKKMGAASAAKRLAANELTGAPTVGLTAGAPSSYGAIGSMTPSVGRTAAAMPGPASSASMYGKIPMPKIGAMPSIATQTGSVAGGGGAGSMAGAAKDAAKKAGGYIERNQQMLGGAAKGIAGVLGSRAEGEAAAGKLALEQSQFDYLKEQNKAEQEKRRRLAQLTGQMFAPQMANINASGRGTPAMTLEEYINASGANATPEEFGPELMEYINNRPTRPPRPSPVTAFGPA